MSDKFYKIEEVSKMTGLTKRAIRYYEDLNLIAPQRAESAYRLYTDEDLEKIQRIISLKESLGFSLAEIKNALELDKDVQTILSTGTAEAAILGNYMEMIREQIKLIDEKVSKLLATGEQFENLLARLNNLRDRAGKENTR
ncbi:MAG: MerR family transcriptional regulator [Acidobacteriota bacterium]|nr:MerR family transcriptional regulator [Acidobacteriota bacterium]